MGRKKSSVIGNFWKTKSNAVKTLKRASTLNSPNLINRMLNLRSDYNDALTNTTRENIKPALRQKRTKPNLIPIQVIQY
ncbi:hypothetical protein Glove_481g33 [Diversispora epigaea]|uniref:Uncharacterized protein n=1 Tax=Diversispora epigaea TaxID=1348612 RepID=A0A397GJT6_9GLOM|nr:hypothetical protein Glove_481g33 [Diversispora epigaea]